MFLLSLASLPDQEVGSASSARKDLRWSLSDATDDVLIDEVSLAENIERAPLHPVDQFRAFQAMREKGMTEEAIAAAFLVDAKVVKQRLRLVSVAPALLEIYAEDGMTLEQLMAFSISSDHERQVQVWDAVKDSWSKEPYQIRRLLTETTVRASDKRVTFVGIEAYEAAGGYVLRDLFQQDDGGWLPEPLRMEGPETAAGADSGDGVDAEALPDFLADDGDGDDALEEEEQDPAHRIAAE